MNGEAAAHLDDLFDECARKSPGECAFRQGTNTVSYGRLSEEVNGIAVWLRSLGVGSGDRVVAYCRRDLRFPALVGGILKAGAVCVPVDVGDPAARVQRIVEAASATVVVTNSSVDDGPGGCAPAGFLRLPAFAALPPPEIRGSDYARDESDPAFLFFTSGSSGVPKGVVLGHGALLRGQRWLQSFFRLTRGDVQLFRSSLSVTNIVREIFWPLVSGTECVLLGAEHTNDVEEHVRAIDACGISVVVVVPVMLKAFLATAMFRGCTTLRYVITSSDVLRQDLVDEFHDRGPRARLFNLYGLTEAFYAACHECQREDRGMADAPIGQRAQLSLHVLDDEMRPVPTGAVGELYISGNGLANGYYEQPEETARRFMRINTGELAFRTGDLARRDASGVHHLLGREDHQVKVRGFRVEISEIEFEIRRRAEIDEVVVVDSEEVSGHKALVAVLQPTPGTSIDVPGLDAFLRNLLPNYMVPSRYVVRDRLPLTYNGKVDRASVRKSLSRADQLRGRTGTPPEGEVECTIAAVWRPLLGLEEVFADENFFELGGDSISGFLAASELRRAGIEVAPATIFEAQTIRDLARFVLTKGGARDRRDRSGEGHAQRKYRGFDHGAYARFGWTYDKFVALVDRLVVRT